MIINMTDIVLAIIGAVVSITTAYFIFRTQVVKLRGETKEELSDVSSNFTKKLREQVAQQNEQIEILTKRINHLETMRAEEVKLFNIEKEALQNAVELYRKKAEESQLELTNERAKRNLLEERVDNLTKMVNQLMTENNHLQQKKRAL